MAKNGAGLAVFAVGCVALAFLLSAPANGASVLGQVATGEVKIDGAPAPAGTTLLSPTVLSTGAKPGLVYLENGQVLALAPGTSTQLESTAAGRVQASVLSGSLLVKRSSGTLMTVAANDVVQVDQEGAQIGEGRRIGEAEEMVELCRLVGWTAEIAKLCAEAGPLGWITLPSQPDPYQCKWELIEVAPDEVEAHLAEGDVYPGVDNNPYRLDMDCKEEERAPAWLANVGNSELIVASLLGAVTVAYWIDQDQEDRAASVVQPRSQ